MPGPERNNSKDDVIKRLEALEEEKAVLQTLYRYGHSIDYGLEREWVELFTEDGAFEVRFRQKNSVMRHEGRQALARFIAGHTRAPAVYHKHFMVEPLIAIKQNKEATVDSYFTRLDENQGKAYLFCFGRYRDHLVKEDGRWRFKERICEVEVFSPQLAGK